MATPLRPSPDQLLVFATVADEGSLSGAARRLSVTQPAVSARLRGLQAVIGTRLYVATSRGIRLTTAGETLLPHARAVARATTRAAASLGQGERECTVAVSEAAIPLVVPVIAREAVGDPHVDLEIVQCDAATAVRLVADGHADLAVSVAAPESDGHDLVHHTVLVDEIVAVCARNVAMPRRLVGVGDCTVLWQARGSGARATVERALEGAGVWPPRSVEAASTFGAHAAAAAGAGVAFLPRRFVEAYGSQALTIGSFGSAGLRARFAIASHRPEELSSAVRQVHAALVDALTAPA